MGVERIIMNNHQQQTERRKLDKVHTDGSGSDPEQKGSPGSSIQNLFYRTFELSWSFSRFFWLLLNRKHQGQRFCRTKPLSLQFPSPHQVQRSIRRTERASTRTRTRELSKVSPELDQTESQSASSTTDVKRSRTLQNHSGSFNQEGRS